MSTKFSKLELARASQIVFHTLPVWGLKNQKKLEFAFEKPMNYEKRNNLSLTYEISIYYRNCSTKLRHKSMIIASIRFRCVSSKTKSQLSQCVWPIEFGTRSDNLVIIPLPPRG